MALDFFEIDDDCRQRRLYGLTDTVVLDASEALDSFRTIFGFHIDPYGRTKLSVANLVVLREQLQKLRKVRPEKDVSIASFVTFLDERILRNQGLIAEGD
jgi:hypothetical protein